MVASYFYGHDSGNSMVSGVAYRGRTRYRALSFPSQQASGSLKSLTELRELANQSVYGEQEYVLGFRDEETFHGMLAFESRDASSARDDISRYWSVRNLRSLLVCSGMMIPEEIYDLWVVTGMPIGSYSKENRKLVKQCLEGHHQFTLNGKPRYAAVHVSRVIMEGAGALIAYGTEEPNARQGAIDIGGRTTDVFATIGQVPRSTDSWCQGYPVGVEKIGLYLNEIANEHLGRTFEPRDLLSIQRASVGREAYPRLYWKGSPISEVHLRNWVTLATEKVAREITSFVSKCWHTNERGDVAADFARVLLVGGGAYYFKDAFRAMLPHAQMPREPELANATGYAGMAAALGNEPHLHMVAS